MANNTTTSALAAQIEKMEAERDMVSVPRGLLGSAISAIDKKRDAPRTLDLLRHYAYSRTGESNNAQQPPAAVPVVPDDELIDWVCQQAIDARHVYETLDALKIVNEIRCVLEQRKSASAPAAAPVVPATQFKPVADLYGISVPGGRSVTYSTDASAASDYRAMGWAVQEFVKLESYQHAAEPVSKPYKLPPHVYSELVNSLRDTAVMYNGCQQLRERLNTTLGKFIQPGTQQSTSTAAGNWIPCSERMPGDETTVHVADAKTGISWIADVDNGEFYPDEYPQTRLTASEITHWMQLPAAPEDN